jgi:arsenate reductase
MRERGLDLSQNKAKSIADIGWQVLDFAYVVTVCDDASAEACPVVPTSGQRLHWSFADPSTFRGTSEEVYAQTRRVRDDIERAIDEWVASVSI